MDGSPLLVQRERRELEVKAAAVAGRDKAPEVAVALVDAGVKAGPAERAAVRVLRLSRSRRR